jgi:hypothetical protein
MTITETEKWICDMLRPMLLERCHGELSIKIKDGHVVHVAETVGHKPPEKKETEIWQK